MRLVPLVLTAVLGFLPAHADPDRPGSKDHPLLTRMQNMHIVAYRTQAFDSYAFKGPKGKTTPVEGRFFEIRYQADKGTQAPSPLAIHRNHQAALRALGGTVLLEEGRYTTVMVAKGGAETWIQVDSAWGGGYQLTIVEKAGMAQEVTANADAFRAGLGAAGHVEVPGIHFDSGKAELKEDSRAAVAEVAALLKASPALKVFVVGHTDSVAAPDLNLRLSQARAESVVQALVKQHGIAPARLRGFGAGPFAPVASNDTEEGRGKNRRVELVKQ